MTLGYIHQPGGRLVFDFGEARRAVLTPPPDYGVFRNWEAAWCARLALTPLGSTYLPSGGGPENVQSLGVSAAGLARLGQAGASRKESIFLEKPKRRD